MGTNFYAEIHLGKSSFDCEPNGSFSWASLLKDERGETVVLADKEKPIYDEYGQRYTLAQFETIVSRKAQRYHIGEEFS